MAATTTSTPLLEVRGATVHFGGIAALEDVDLHVAAGELCGVIGPNGAGKSTLFDVISGHRTPTRGKVHVDGADVTERSAVWRARNGMRRTFQRQQVFGPLTVEENLLAAQDWRRADGGLLADLAGITVGRTHRRRRAELADQMIEICGLADVRHVPAGLLPIGRARVVELARAAVDEPRLLLLDEPSSGLGSQDTDAMASIIERLRDETGCGVLLVEHDIGFVMRLSDRVVVLNLGTVLASGTTEEIQAHQGVREAYLG